MGEVMKKIKEDKEFLTTREAARLLEVGLSTVQGWVEAGILPAWKTAGGHRRIPAAMIEKIRAEQRAALGIAEPAAPFKVLVVEDDAVQREIYRHELAKLSPPVELHLAENGFIGLVMVGQLSPDLLITDLVMPEMDGFSLIRELHPKTLAGDSIIVATALHADDIAARGGLPEAVVVHTKPVSFPALRTLIAERRNKHQSPPATALLRR